MSPPKFSHGTPAKTGEPSSPPMMRWRLKPHEFLGWLCQPKLPLEYLQQQQIRGQSSQTSNQVFRPTLSHFHCPYIPLNHSWIEPELCQGVLQPLLEEEEEDEEQEEPRSCYVFR